MSEFHFYTYFKYLQRSFKYLQRWWVHFPEEGHCVIISSTSLCWCREFLKQKPAMSELTVKEGTLHNVFQIWTHLFPRPSVLHLPSPSMKVSLHGSLVCIFPGQFSCRPRHVLPLVALVHFLLQDVISDTFPKPSWLLCPVELLMQKGG